MSDWRKTAMQALSLLEELNKLSHASRPDAIALPGEIDDAMDALRLAIGEHDMAEYQRLDALDKLAEEAQEMGLYD
jgi:hypothetical protein